MGALSEHLLSTVIFAPLFFAVVVAFLPSGERGQMRTVAMAGMTVTFLLTLFLYLSFDASPQAPEFQFAYRTDWVKGLGIGYHVGVDGIAVTMILLTGFLGPIVLLSAWGVTERVKELMLAILAMQTAMLGTFAALDLALFYVFWESMLLPMYLLIGVWGSSNRVYAAVKFFLYTFAGSVLMLVAILYVYFHSGVPGDRTFDFPSILNALGSAEIGFEARKYLFLAFIIAFAVKVPMFPLHTWLPDAHTEAPAAGSIILAGVLLKMGVFGFLRYAMPMFPDAAAYFRPTLAALAVVGIVYGSMMSFVQRDMKRLVAYSSVAHLGFVMLGVLALSTQAQTGAIYQMVNHGISTGALFLLIGLLYERTHTREIARYGGIAKVVPMFAAVFLVITLSSIGLPGTNGFIGEFMILAGAFTSAQTVTALPAPEGVVFAPFNGIALAVVGATGVILGAVYMLKMYERVMLGPVRHEDVRGLKDLTGREWLAVGPLVVLVVAMGVFPQPFLDRIEPSSARFHARMTTGPVQVPVADAEKNGTRTGAVQVLAPVAPGAPAPQAFAVPGPRRLEQLPARLNGQNLILRPVPAARGALAPQAE